MPARPRPAVLLRRLAVLAVALALVAVPASPVAAAEAGDVCSDTATVRWNVDPEAQRVLAAVVEVPGCADGSPVGLRLLTDGDGQIPTGDPLVAAVAGQQATFDLVPLEVAIVPVMGVEVFLVGSSPTPDEPVDTGDTVPPDEVAGVVTEREVPGAHTPALGRLPTTGAALGLFLLTAALCVLTGWSMAWAGRRLAGRRGELR